MWEVIAGVVSLLVILAPLLVKLLSRKEKKRKEDAARENDRETSDRATTEEIVRRAKERAASRDKQREAAEGWNPDTPLLYSFKTPKLKKEFDGLPSRLREAFFSFCIEANRMRKAPVITRVLAAIEGATGVHPSGRALDIRDEFCGEHTYTEAQRTALLDAVNKQYPRPDKYDTLIHHKFKDQPAHFHMQIPIEWV